MEYCIQTLEAFIKDIAKESHMGSIRSEILNGVGTAQPVSLNEDFSVEQPSPTVMDIEPSRSPDPLELDNEQQASSRVSQTLSDNETMTHMLPPAFPEDELIDWEALIAVLKDITSGLIYIHSQKFVHRDLKPRNGTTLAPSFLI